MRDMYNSSTVAVKGCVNRGSAQPDVTFTIGKWLKQGGHSAGHLAPDEAWLAGTLPPHPRRLAGTLVPDVTLRGP